MKATNMTLGRKPYITPSMEVVIIKTQVQLLAGSVTETEADLFDDEIDGGSSL